ncbi:MAG: hypothetical protein LBQ88_05070, partial [Treponema sp.]|nr:hypothetical protein [Treponema sp.]
AWMLFHPNDRIALIRKNFKAAADVIRAIAGAMEREEVQAIFKQAHGKAPRPEISAGPSGNGRRNWSGR